MALQEWYEISTEEALSRLHATHQGLTLNEAGIRLSQFGYNRLATHKGPSLWVILLRQFFTPFVFILLGALVVKLAVANFLDASMIAGTIFIMAFIGFFQEARAEKAMHALKQLATPKSKVRREGKIGLIASELLVPGDIILLEAGDRVPTDARILECTNFKVDESTLTGESMPVEKESDALEDKLVLAERRNMIYMGTSVSCGKATACVISTGMMTELGKIASVLQAAKIEKTPLQKSIDSIGRWMIGIIFCAILLFITVSSYRGLGWLDVFLLAVAAAVSAIPEGLPLTFTVALAAGMSMMAKRHAIIRKLVAVETLGSTTVICSDKTGTFTFNRMTVTNLYTFGKFFEITDHTFTWDGQPVDPHHDSSLKWTLEIGTLCNDALITRDDGKFQMIGDPTEGALLLASAKANLHPEHLEASFPRIDEIPFQSENLYMATLHSFNGREKVLIKGAPEKILSFCGYVLKGQEIILLTEAEKEEITRAIAEMTQKALRLIAVAYYDLPQYEGLLIEPQFKGKMIFTGIFGMIDPPRPEAIKAISDCKQAGVRVVMVTGDNKMTAEAIAHQLGIPGKGAISGQEIEAMQDEELDRAIKTINVFARVEPLHKLRIVQAFKKQGQVVAMTGDGVNDAPALEMANIGVAMGISGTDVAKEASDMVLSDDNFASIVAAVEEGRAIFNRLRNVATFLLTTCFGELFGLIFSVLVMGLAPLLPLQILWLNLITGVVVSIPLGLEPKNGMELKQPPRNPNVGLLYRGMIQRIAFLSLMLGLSIFFVFKIGLASRDIDTVRTMVLCNVAMFEWLLAFNVRSDELTIFRLGICKNGGLLISISLAFALQLMILYTPFFQKAFKITPLFWHEWLIALFPSILIFAVETLRKEFFPKLFSRGKWSR